MGKTIPQRVTIDAVNEALEPFYELLGINKNSVFASPGIHFGPNEITFVVPAVPEGRWATDRPAPALPGEPFHPQVGSDDAAAENMLAVTVRVVHP